MEMNISASAAGWYLAHVITQRIQSLDCTMSDDYEISIEVGGELFTKPFGEWVKIRAFADIMGALNLPDERFACDYLGDVDVYDSLSGDYYRMSAKTTAERVVIERVDKYLKVVEVMDFKANDYYGNKLKLVSKAIILNGVEIDGYVVRTFMAASGEMSVCDGMIEKPFHITNEIRYVHVGKDATVNTNYLSGPVIDAWYRL